MNNFFKSYFVLSKLTPILMMIPGRIKSSFDGKAITYDAIGNPLTYGGDTYTWEQGRQLAGKTGKTVRM
ncbi:hypothetical protein LGK95_19465 [Clostridium algoriphilum]|uniref:hypothetical protein n=1 Tax=Clostridium algoriphilum TaxID=198347 RepID=UPI001CF47DFA|nr:hypothetical protein [Clostridium algoriphilum]MCB2295658.1 hypothetical protein [Clostridium algoriphilum]